MVGRQRLLRKTGSGGIILPRRIISIARWTTCTPAEFAERYYENKQVGEAQQSGVKTVTLSKNH